MQIRTSAKHRLLRWGLPTLLICLAIALVLTLDPWSDQHPPAAAGHPAARLNRTPRQEDRETDMTEQTAVSPLRAYWTRYDATLDRIRTEKPCSFAALKAILDDFEPPSSGDAFFPGGADETLWGALVDAGWEVYWAKADYHFKARVFDPQAKTWTKISHVEGDVYNLTKE